MSKKIISISILVLVIAGILAACFLPETRYFLSIAMLIVFLSAVIVFLHFISRIMIKAACSDLTEEEVDDLLLKNSCCQYKDFSL